MFIELVRKRKTCRNYSSESLSDTEKALILEAAEKAPTSRNLHCVRFVGVEDMDTIRELAGVKDSGAEPLRNATFAVVVVSYPDIADTWIEDSSIASIFMQMEAEDLGIGSCWIQIRMRKLGDVDAEENVRRIMGLDAKARVLSIVAFGKKR